MRKFQKLKLTVMLSVVAMMAPVMLNQRTTVKAASVNIAINKTNFPDDKFRQYILDNIDNNKKDNMLSETEINDVTILRLSEVGIKDLEGIQYFTELKTLYCDGNELTKLDVSGLNQITTIDCYDNAIEELNLTDLSELSVLYCYDNQIKNLDLTAASKIKILGCANNRLEEIKFGGTSKLDILDCEYNKLTNLDAIINSPLTYLTCSNNELTELKLENTYQLIDLKCYNNKITNLNLTGAIQLKNLYCNNNQLKILKIEDSKKLEKFNCGDNELETLNVSDATALTALYCHGNKLTDLNVTGLNKLTHLSCDGNQIETLALQGLSKLTRLSISNNKISQIDLETQLQLEELYCDNNMLKQLDLKALSNLNRLYCYNNLLTGIDVARNRKLSLIQCDRALKIDGLSSSTMVFRFAVQGGYTPILPPVETPEVPPAEEPSTPPAEVPPTEKPSEPAVETPVTPPAETPITPPSQEVIITPPIIIEGDTVYVPVEQPSNSAPVIKNIATLNILKVKDQVYTGKAKKPAVTIMDGVTALVLGRDYKVTYKNNKKFGKATVTITGLGNYVGSKKVYFNVTPKTVKISKITSSAKATATLSWAKDKNATGYQVYYATAKKGKYKLAGTTTKNQITVKKLKSGKKGYFKVRAYKKVGKTKIYGSYSAIKTFKIK